jgi:hypothetical protein
MVVYSFMRTRQAAAADASSPPSRPIRTRSMAASEAAAEGKDEKDEEGGAMDTAPDEDVNRSGPRLRSSGLSLGPDDFAAERAKGKREQKDEDDEEALRAAEVLADFEFEASNESYRPPKARQLQPSERKEDQKEEKKDGKEEKKDEKQAKKRRRSSEEEVSEEGGHVLKWAECTSHWVCDHCDKWTSPAWMCWGHGNKCNYVECDACHNGLEPAAEKKVEAEWTTTLTDQPGLRFSGPTPGPQHINNTDPLSLFQLFLTDDDISSMVTATNASATAKFKDKKVPPTTPTSIIHNPISFIQKTHRFTCSCQHFLLHICGEEQTACSRRHGVAGW